MLSQRRRRWPNIEPALVQCLVFHPAVDHSTTWTNVETFLGINSILFIRGAAHPEMRSQTINHS